MSLLAESVGAYDEAVEWAQRTTIGGGALNMGAQALLSGALMAADLAAHRWAEIVRAADVGDLDEARETEEFAELDEEHRAQRATRFAARLTLIALAIEVVRVGLQDRASAQTIGRTAAELSRDCAARHGGSRLWSGAAEVFEAMEQGSSTWRELWDKAAIAQAQGNSALQVMYGIAAMTSAGPREAIQIQLQTVPWLERLFSPTLYHATVARFVPEYWRWALDQFPMNFGLLNRTRKALSEAQELDEKTRVHAILHVVAFSLGIQVPEHLQRWLDPAGV